MNLYWSASALRSPSRCSRRCRSPPKPQTDAALAESDRVEELERKLDLLTDELRAHAPGAGRARGDAELERRLRPRPRGLEGLRHRARALDRRLRRGVRTSRSSHDKKDPSELEPLRRAAPVLYVGYKFSDRIVFNSEIEFEHAPRAARTSARQRLGLGGVRHPRLPLARTANVRAGLLLVPMGFINEIHEPPFFYGVQRPETERRIIPTTWRENGAGVCSATWARRSSTASTRCTASTRRASPTPASAAAASRATARWPRTSPSSAGSTGRRRLPSWLLGGSVYEGDSGQDQEVGDGDHPRLAALIFGRRTRSTERAVRGARPVRLHEPLRRTRAQRSRSAVAVDRRDRRREIAGRLRRDRLRRLAGCLFGGEERRSSRSSASSTSTRSTTCRDGFDSNRDQRELDLHAGRAVKPAPERGAEGRVPELQHPRPGRARRRAGVGGWDLRSRRVALALARAASCGPRPPRRCSYSQREALALAFPGRRPDREEERGARRCAGRGSRRGCPEPRSRASS